MSGNTPFIGLLCMDRKDGMKKEICSYIDSKYVEYLVAGGAKVVPIWNNKDLEYYYDVLNKVNGVLLPGGAVYVNEHDPSRLDLTNYYVRATEIIIRIAKEKFDKGIHLPIWGTCLGFQLLVLYTTETAATTYGTDPRDKCQPMNCDLKVEFLPDFRDSRLFAHLPPELEIIMRNEPFGRHRHRYCWTTESCKSFNDWQILAKNTDGNGTEFASIMEHRRYPFYGSQFHPESDCPEHCLKVREYLAKFFVDDSGRYSNRFVNAERYEIHNFPKIAGKGNDQIYAFGESPDYPD
ncbi:gamma-glutamyl hydrolase-like isoform X1 [Anastrepha obliqua]|uniref:gamma-glutamyl hydrolase-like isoform X1 n=1 Tax=Anastrepha obliqua TaxID=95512 RepID=UPI002409CC48|nr:gamma-glutamyl hydrolase-like isoform X1 [Anastrepha obliqua]XP_054732886.1 gamma-glutamyl hydrolase-like isoform X1 [Anastrepha obliqua]XP_054732887.1 gamma-glutamyl hydrolase-like isoform X1 [Anastrepha obliqua]XP_054732888.1 gamma-glutamyl hydrolase-like isoform X1 [Anastrepha obliqua]